MATMEQLVEQFKAWVTEQPCIPETSVCFVQRTSPWSKPSPGRHCPEAENLLKSFISCCDNDLDKAKTTIQTYYTMRANGPEIFQHRDVDNPTMKNILSVFHTFITPKTTPEGYTVLISHLIDTDTKKYDMIAQMKYLIMTLESTLVDDPVSPGHIIVFDISALSPGHVLKFSPSGIRKTSNYLQEAIPLHMQAVYLVNASAVVDIMIKTVKPFLNMDLFKRTFIYRSGEIDKLYEKVPKDCLPEEYGGYLPPSATLNEKNTEKLRQLKEHFEREDAIIRSVEGLFEK